MAEMHTVKSSRIHAIGWDANTQKLHIQFKRGDLPGETFTYDNFPYSKWEAFKAAASKGKHFEQHVKGKHIFNNISPGAKARPV